MNRLLIILFLLSGASVWAQTADTVRWTKDVVEKSVWNQSPSVAEPLRFVGYIKIERRREYVGQTRHTHYATHAKWLRSESFMADSLSQRYKPLAQLYFDCFELESRVFQQTVNVTGIDIGEELQAAEKRVGARMTGIRSSTQNGADTAQVAYWREWMDSALLATPRIYLPAWEFGKFDLGFHVGGGVAVFNGQLSDYFTTLPGWGWGFGVRYKRIAFDYNQLIGYTQSKLPFEVADFQFGDTTHLQVHNASASVGYQLLRGRKWEIVPYIAAHSFRLINRDQPEASLFAKSRSAISPEAGIITEWRFYEPIHNNYLRFSWKLMLKAGYTVPMQYLGKIDGGALLVQIGIGWTVRTIVNPRE
jgi:hypothetical protein